MEKEERGSGGPLRLEMPPGENNMRAGTRANAAELNSWTSGKPGESPGSPRAGTVAGNDYVHA